MNEIFLDTETTGLSFLENHKIVEIACIETKDLIPTKNYFHQLINPQRNVPPEAYKIHGYSTEFLKDKKVFKEIAEQFQNFIKDKKIIIHNASFDLGFLNHELRLIKKNEIKAPLEEHLAQEFWSRLWTTSPFIGLEMIYVFLTTQLFSRRQGTRRFYQYIFTMIKRLASTPWVELVGGGYIIP